MHEERRAGVDSRTTRSSAATLPTDAVVYLTFDDGPDPVYTPAVQAVLARYKVRATFFVIGQSVEKYPEVVRATAAAGHLVANHTFTHPRLKGIGQPEFDAEIEATDRAMRRALGGAPAPLMRPPYGSTDEFTQSYAESHGLRMVLWDVDPNDWAEPGAAAITSHVLQEVCPGAVILLHDGGGDRSGTVAALSAIIPALLDQGFLFDTIATV